MVRFSSCVVGPVVRSARRDHRDTATYERCRDFSCSWGRPMIKWRTIKRERFDQVVEALLCRTHDDAGDFNTTYFGDGGDGGIDCIAVTENGAVTIYQLKCFPDGIAANRSRMGQIRCSFEKASTEQPLMSRWVLVLPTKATQKQEKQIRELGQRRPVAIEIWNRARLDRAGCESEPS